ncbi:MAG: hypothetical protein M8467_06825 [Anaerolineae bacterium]|nr:hypothetical protein [Anaerolineae bacterium]
MTDKEPLPTARGWHVADWPALAWLETGIKLLAIVAGIAALVQALVSGGFRLPMDLRLVQLVAMVVLSLGLVAAILDRYLEREVVSMVFVLLNNLGHWGMVVALVSRAGPGWLLPAFALLMLAGDAVKLVFLRLHDFHVRNTPRALLFGLTSFYIVGFLVVLLVELMLVFRS